MSVMYIIISIIVLIRFYYDSTVMTAYYNYHNNVLKI